jgi:hypothetical protein
MKLRVVVGTIVAGVAATGALLAFSSPASAASTGLKLPANYATSAGLSVDDEAAADPTLKSCTTIPGGSSTNFDGWVFENPTGDVSINTFYQLTFTNGTTVYGIRLGPNGATNMLTYPAIPAGTGGAVSTTQGSLFTPKGLKLTGGTLVTNVATTKAVFNLTAVCPAGYTPPTKGNPAPSPSPSKSPSKSPSASPSASKSVSTSPSAGKSVSASPSRSAGAVIAATPTPPAGSTPALALTGANVALMSSVAAVLLGGGMFLLLLRNKRRRHTEPITFVAE